jgi:hypothetical protein
MNDGLSHVVLSHVVCHVSSRTGRALQVSHTDYHWDRPRSYCHTPLTLAVSLLSCGVSCDV